MGLVGIVGDVGTDGIVGNDGRVGIVGIAEDVGIEGDAGMFCFPLFIIPTSLFTGPGAYTGVRYGL